MYECQNCDYETEDIDELDAIDNIFERVDAGEIMPAGQCPDCGCLVHEREDAPLTPLESEMLSAIKSLVAKIEEWNNGDPVSFGDAFEIAVGVILKA